MEKWNKNWSAKDDTFEIEYVYLSAQCESNLRGLEPLPNRAPFGLSLSLSLCFLMWFFSSPVLVVSIPILNEIRMERVECVHYLKKGIRIKPFITRSTRAICKCNELFICENNILNIKFYLKIIALEMNERCCWWCRHGRGRITLLIGTAVNAVPNSKHFFLFEFGHRPIFTNYAIFQFGFLSFIHLPVRLNIK